MAQNKHIKRITLFLGLILLYSESPAQWQVATPFAGGVNDLYFTNSRDGIAVGTQAGLGNCQLSAFLAKTIDGGENWVRIFLPGVNTTNLNAVDFGNEQTALAAGTNSVIIRSADGGFTWTQVSAGVGSGYNDIAFAGVNQATVVGNNGLIRYSANGGVTWNTVNSGTTQSLYSISFPVGTTGFIGGANGTLLKTTNGGSSWSAINTGNNYFFNNLYFVDNNHGFAGTGNTLYQTDNGGLQWTAQNIAISQIRSIFFSDSLNGFIGSDDGKIALTSNGGQSWNVIQTGYNTTLDALFSPDGNIIFGSGSLGSILVSENQGQEWRSTASGLGQEQFDVLTLNSDISWTCGKNGSLLRTTNAGMNWQKMKVPEFANFLCLSKLNTNHIVAGADSGRIFICSNQSWSPVPVYSDTGFAIISIHFPDSLHGFAIGSSNKFLVSNNGGFSWNPVPNNISIDYFTDVYFLNAMEGFCSGANGIFKTTDAGLNWTYYPVSSASGLKSIHFVNDSTGFCAGSFGRLMKTTDGGQLWLPSDNGTSSVNIRDICSINDSSLWFARNTSQSFTIDGGIIIGSQSTYCLANNWSMNGIDVGVFPDTIGFCSGGINGIMHKLSYKGIDHVYVSSDAYCSGGLMEVGFRGSGIVDASTTYYAELSDATGSFSNPLIIGSLNVGSIYQLREGIIRAQIPSNIPAGNGYRVRVVSISPVLTGPDNGHDISIGSTITPSASVINLSGTLCLGQPISLQANIFGAGNSGNFTWLLNGAPVSNNNQILLLNSFSNGDSVSLIVNSSLSCAIPNQVISAALPLQANSAPIISAGSDTAVCPGSTLNLAAQGQASFRWLPSGLVSNDSIANPSVTINTNTLLVLEGSVQGCLSRDSLLISVLPVPELQLPPMISLCENNCQQIIPGLATGFSDVHWSSHNVLSDTGIIDPIVCAGQGEWLQVTLTNSNTCTLRDSLYLEVLATPIVSVPFQSFDTLLCNTVGTFFQWFSGGIPIPGADTSYFLPQQDGWYSVMVTSQNGCSASSDSIYYLISLTGDQKALSTFLFPNPSQDVWKLSIKGENKAERISLFDSSGRKLWSMSEVAIPAILEARDLKSGIYMLEILHKHNLQRIKLIRQ